MAAGTTDDSPVPPEPVPFGAAGLKGWARRNPGYLLRVFTVGSGLGILALLAIVGLGVHRLSDHQVVRNAEANAIALAQAAFPAPSARALAVVPEAVAALDDRLRPSLRSLGIVKIKVFARDGTIVYSTDRPIIGQVERGNESLARALAGTTVSNLRTRDRPWPLAGEQRFEVDVVDTYVPIRDGAEVVGTFGTHADVTWARGESGTVLRFSLVIALSVLLGVFGALFLLMRTLTRQLADAQHDLEQMAITDALTGLANRRYLMARAEEECARVARLRDKAAAPAGVGFIMADIDHFKPVNDTHGHLAGDQVLREVASRIRRVTRRYDVVGRYGGDEFLIVLPQADPGETRAVADRVWQTVRERPFPVGDGTWRLSVSVGIACATPGDDDFTAVLKRADEALYAAKGAGRDRVAAG